MFDSTMTASALQDEEMQRVARRAGHIAANISSVILGKEDVIRACVVALLAGGHIIVEDFPGVGKTLLAKSLARSVNCRNVARAPCPVADDSPSLCIVNAK